MKNDPINPFVLSAEKRARQFLIPAHDEESERADAFKRANELLLSAASEFIRAGSEDLARRAHSVHRLAEKPCA